LAARWNPMSRILGALRGQVTWVLLSLWAAAMVGGTLAVSRRSDRPAFRAYGMAAVFVGSAALLSAIMTPVGDGYMEIEKHAVFVAWWTAPLVAGAGVALVALGWTRIRPMFDRRHPLWHSGFVR